MRERTMLIAAMIGWLALTGITPASAVESIIYGVDGISNYPGMTSRLRLSTQVGKVWWTGHFSRRNPENAEAIPFAYHDGYIKWLGETNHNVDTSPAACALRWHRIKTGKGDSWLPASASSSSDIPGIIVLDEINASFNDHARGPELRQALRLYTTEYGDQRDIVLLASPGLSMGRGVLASNYSNVVFCANNYVRWFGLEIYCSYQGFLTGHDPANKASLGTGDTYLANRLSYGIRNWTTTMGVSPAKVMALFAVGTFAGSHDTGHPDACAFLNREFWFLANGWHDAGHSGVDQNLKTVLRNGVGGYTFSPGNQEYRLPPGENARNRCFEKLIAWYCSEGHTNAAPGGLAVPP